MRAKVLILMLSAGLVALTASAPRAQEPPPPAARQLELTFHGDGTITLVAQGVSMREVLDEWARRGGSRIQGAERLTGALTTPVKYTKQAEAAVLESLLRSAAGLILMPRVAGMPGASRLDVTVLATSNATAMYGGQAPMTSSMPTSGNPDSEIPPVPNMQPQPGQPQQTQAPPPPPQNRPSGVVPVTVVPVTPVTPGTTTTTGRGGGGR
jgi:hypothetical protein